MARGSDSFQIGDPYVGQVDRLGSGLLCWLFMGSAGVLTSALRILMVPLGLSASLGSGVGADSIAFNGLPETLKPSLYHLEEVFTVPQLGLTRITGAREGSSVFYATTKSGMIYAFNDLAAPRFWVFLDLMAHTFSTGGESGLQGMAVHPNFEENGNFFVFYSTQKETDEGLVEYDRLSRFTARGGPLGKVDLKTEEVLLEQPREVSLHHGGDLKFGPDGYLYVSLGDASTHTDRDENSQQIDGGFHAGILRIDVDGRVGNLPPNPHHGVVRNYWIPQDNPFLDTRFFHGIPIDTTNLRTEFYAVGLRNPWAMSFDPLTGDLFTIDTGQAAFEEVNRVEKGANYGWALVEGDRVYHFKQKDLVEYDRFEGPLLQYPHSRGNLAISGGTLYRGHRFPEFDSQFVFADYGGNIGVFDPFAADPQETLQWIAHLPGCAVVFSEPSSGDIFFGEFRRSRVHRLKSPLRVGGLPPERLSEIGLFTDLETLTPVPGLSSYEVNHPFWSDGATKRRWLALNEEAAMIQFRAKGAWGVPTGSVFVKHFDLEMIVGDPGSIKRLETRVLVKTTESVYGVSYRWNDTQTDAELVPAAGQEIPMDVVDENGVLRTRSWLYPSRSECLSCHTAVGGYVLGLNTLQLNRPDDGVRSLNQIDRLAHTGLVSGAPDEVWRLPAYAKIDDESKSIEYRVRSYLGANCAHCHQPYGPTRALWDARFYTPTDEMGLIDTKTKVYGFRKNHKLIEAPDPQKSMLAQRLKRLGAFYMPPIGSYRINEAGSRLVSRWIHEVIPEYPSLPDWKTTHFTGASLSDGALTEDPDQDGLSNRLEFLLGTDPLSPEPEAWNVSIVREETRVLIKFPRVANLGFEIQFSDSLEAPIDWRPLPVSGGEHSYASREGKVEVVDTLDAGESRYYRVQVASLWR